MKTLNVDLTYCYGINKLKYSFDFTSKATYAIYSPNGVMKTSFAKTFCDIIENRETKDLIFPENPTVRIVQDENGTDIQADNVFVIKPYVENYTSEKVSLLLANAQLKSEYENINKIVNEKKESFLKAMKEMSGMTSRNDNIEEEISNVIMLTHNEFNKALSRLENEVNNEEPPLYETIIYKKIFTDRIIKFLSSSDVKEKLEEYIKKYNELIFKSRYFQKGIFNHTNASTIAKTLKNNGFFKAQHTVNLRDDDKAREITNEKELTEVIEHEKQKILTNPELKVIFENIDNKLNKNQELQGFRDYLIQNISIIPELNNLELFKSRLWKSYFKVHKDLFIDYLDEYKKGIIENKRIVEQAKSELTQWSHVIDDFNERFSVPFKLMVGNKIDVMLNSELPILEFEFNGQNGDKSVTKEMLLKVLSNGEKRALYILNILFEVQARQESSTETLFIIDDIADSFDYKNKYAIIEYLKDISEISGFRQIILSHNYDFFRTVTGRLDMERDQKLNTIKLTSSIIIDEEVYQNNPFEYWIDHLSDKDNMLIAAIPFIRNIAEYTGDLGNFCTLTSLLHYKDDTETITIKNLEGLFKVILKNQSSLCLRNHTDKVVDLILATAEKLLIETNEKIDLEKKICLSIAIRLKAEIYMVKEIADDAFWKSLGKSQTYRLTERYKQLPVLDSEKVRTINQVSLMTPENIHLNSFMYEPILDMSIGCLKKLYRKVKAL